VKDAAGIRATTISPWPEIAYYNQGLLLTSPTLLCGTITVQLR